VKHRSYYNLLVDVSDERMQSEARHLEHPSTVDMTIGTGQVAVWLKHRLLQVIHSLTVKQTSQNIQCHRWIIFKLQYIIYFHRTNILSTTLPRACKFMRHLYCFWYSKPSNSLSTHHDATYRPIASSFHIFDGSSEDGPVWISSRFFDMRQSDWER